MGIKRVSAKEAVHLAEVGYVIVDVRTVGEYQKGHPKGALNVPFLRAGRFELKDNPDFLPIVEKLFADICARGGVHSHPADHRPL